MMMGAGSLWVLDVNPSLNTGCKGDGGRRLVCSQRDLMGPCEILDGAWA